MIANHRSNAMWLASNWDSVLTSCQDTSLTHPTALREACRDLQSSKAPSPDLDISAPADPGLERIAKVAPVASMKVAEVEDLKPSAMKVLEVETLITLRGPSGAVLMKVGEVEDRKGNAPAPTVAMNMTEGRRP